MIARWVRCLGRDGARMTPTPDGRFAVFPGEDCRRRPLARVDQPAIRAALSDGLIQQEGRSFALTEAGRRAIARHASGQHAAQHRQMEWQARFDEQGRRQAVQVNRLATPLARYARALNGRQIQAGERFCDDYQRSSLISRVTRDWSIDAQRGGSGRGREDAALGRIAAKDRVMVALESVGTRNAGIISAVCIREESLASVERQFSLGRRSGATALAQALDSLASYYRI